MCFSKLDVYGYLNKQAVLLEGTCCGPSCCMKRFLHVILQTLLKALICALFISCASYLVSDTKFWDLLL